VRPEHSKQVLECAPECDGNLLGHFKRVRLGEIYLAVLLFWDKWRELKPPSGNMSLSIILICCIVLISFDCLRGHVSEEPTPNNRLMSDIMHVTQLIAANNSLKSIKQKARVEWIVKVLEVFLMWCVKCLFFKCCIILVGDATKLDRTSETAQPARRLLASSTGEIAATLPTHSVGTDQRSATEFSSRRR